METAAREELGLCAWWGREGRLVSAWKQPSRLHLHHTVHEEPQEARGQEVQNKQRSKKKKEKKSTMQIKSFSMTRRQKSSYF